MKELKDIQFESENIILNGNLVKGSILPKNINQLDRTITIQADTVVEGALYGHKIHIESGDVEIRGAAFAQLELYIASGAKGTVRFNKSIGAVNSVVSHARDAKVMILSDINAREVRLTNAFVGGSIFADEISLTDCVVVGGVFANKELSLKSSIVGTFNSPGISMEGDCAMFLPSGFSLEPIKYNKATTRLYNLSLADLGALYRGLPQAKNTGRILVNLDSDELKSTLANEDSQVSVRNYTVVGKVLAADMIDWEKMQNHFLLTAASLNSQLLDTYDLGLDAEGKNTPLTPENLYGFFKDLLKGKFDIQELDGTFQISDISEKIHGAS